MGRVCAVKNCDSGSEADRRRREADKVRQATLLRVPSDENTRLEWSQILKVNLKKTNAICDIHFKYEDLNFSDEFLEIEGEEVYFPRERITRKKNAKPTLIVLSHKEQLQKLAEEKGRRKLKAQEQKNKINVPQNNVRAEDFMDVDLDSQHEAMEIVPETPNMQTLINSIRQTHLKQGWTYTEKEDFLLFAFVNFNSCKINCYIEIHADMTVSVLSCNRQKLIGLNYPNSIKNVQELSELQQQLESQKWCFGLGIFHQSHSAMCTGIASEEKLSCLNCIKGRFRVKAEQTKRNSFGVNKKTNRPLVSSGMVLLKRKCSYREEKLEEARKLIEALQQQLDKLESDSLHKLKDGLTDVQQEIVTMFDEFKILNSNSFRYSREWICECYIMHTKSTALYEYIRQRGILPLCSPATLNTAVGNMQASYGFQEEVFKSMSIKATGLSDDSKQGILLADEMTISKAVALDKNWMVRGFTDYGPDLTPPNLENEQADHALVLLFCPFRGQWVQPIAAFAARKLNGDTLNKVLKQGVQRIEETGFQVEAIGMDGANVNRSVWERNDVNEETVSCQHPMDVNRRLWYISDGSHLWKNWRTHVLKQEEFWTPDGIVKKKHWRLLLEYESCFKYNLKVAYQLTPDHLDPKGFQTMNVLMATQVFADSVSLAMEMCMKNPQKCPGMNDAQPTITFIKKIRGLIDAMTSRIPGKALQVDENCHSRKVIVEFTVYLENWKKQAKAGKRAFPLPNNTYVGFIVTLKATLEILDSLHKRHNYTFLMTCRLLSDPIERLFGILRIAAGCNIKPDPTIFIYLFKIFCCFDLIKSPKGSNVGKQEVLKVLTSTKEGKASQISNKTALLSSIESWIQQAGGQQQPQPFVQRQDHPYDVVNTDERVISDVSGWVVRRMTQQTRCEDCKKLFVESTASESTRHELTNAKERFGGLIRSSYEVYCLLKQLEDTSTTVLGTKPFTKNLLEKIVDELLKSKPAVLVGCESHKNGATLQFISFYLERRGRFACDRFNRIHNESKKKEKQSRKNVTLG